MQDLRYAVRVLSRAPGFTALAAVVLALGIGANSAIFSVVDAALLRPLPFHQPDRLVMLWEHSPRPRPQPHLAAELPGLARPEHGLRRHGRRLRRQPHAPDRRRRGTHSRARRSPANSSPLLRRSPAGRARLCSEDDARARADVVVISERLWRTRFGGDPAIVGKTIPLDGKPFTVVGVVPAGFQILYESDLWTLLTPKRSPEQRRMHYLQVLGRLKPGVTIEQARSAMDAIAARIARDLARHQQRLGHHHRPAARVPGRRRTAHHLPGAGRRGGVHPV